MKLRILDFLAELREKALSTASPISLETALLGPPMMFCTSRLVKVTEGVWEYFNKHHPHYYESPDCFVFFWQNMFIVFWKENDDFFSTDLPGAYIEEFCRLTEILPPT